ncbi:unnamed protein product [Mycena citricolor]|uniref:Cytochrome c oxidase assembly factor 3 n=1 Tax=Mycena citricolor TaxID=2018698 RepID=A0AAD2HJL1_9AGAR|nr:unnamed protein product [Mycena citricolor]
MRLTSALRASWQPDTLRYVDRSEVKASYWKNGRMSPGLLRARRQFRTKNTFGGVVLLTFVAGVFAYSIAAVKQDVFDDLDDEVKTRALQEAPRVVLSAEDEKRVMQAATSAATKGPTLRKPRADGDLAVASAGADASAAAAAASPRGVVAAFLAKRYPTLLDPTSHTIVWGAPPVDRIGSVGDKMP